MSPLLPPRDDMSSHEAGRPHRSRFRETLRRNKGVGTRSSDMSPKASSESREAWAGFLNEVEAAKAKLDFRRNEECWYRGQKQEHKLIASLFRLLDHGFNTDDDDARSIYEIEYDLYFESVARSPELQIFDLSSWDVLAVMRHHGIPTRLLDWTERLGVAVFFALENPTPGDHPVVWLLNPYLLNEVGLADRDLYSPKYLGYDEDEDTFYSYEDYLVFEGGNLDWDLPIAIYPPQRDPRMRSQMGWFTIWGDDVRPLNDQCPRCAEHVCIPEVAIPAAHEFLSDAGIDYSTIYPDLDGFARMLRTRYGFDRLK